MNQASNQDIINFIASNPSLTAEEITAQLGDVYSRISHILTKLCDQGKLVRVRRASKPTDGKRAISKYHYTIPVPMSREAPKHVPGGVVHDHNFLRDIPRPKRDPLEVIKSLTFQEVCQLRKTLNEMFA